MSETGSTPRPELVQLAPAGTTWLTFGQAMQHLCATPGSTVRRVAWGPDPSVLLINEQDWLCIRKPDGSVRQALLCREDLANDDWVIGG